MSHAIQMTASNWVGQVAVQPLQTKSSNFDVSCCTLRTAFRDYVKRQTGDWDERIGYADPLKNQIRSDYLRDQEGKEQSPATPTRRAAARSPAHAALFRSIVPARVMQFERLPPCRRALCASRDRRSVP